MSSAHVDYAIPDTSRKRSTGLWLGSHMAGVKEGHIDGLWEGDDFSTFFATTNKYAFLAADAAAGCALLATAGELGGILRLTTGGTDENEAYIQGGVNVGPFCEIRNGGGDVWVEGRVRPSSITNFCWYWGLCAPGFMAANAVTDATGVLVDKDFIGFRVLAGDLDGLDAVYNTVSGGGETVHKNEAKVLVANTWYKLGIRYDDSQKKLFFFINGVVVDANGVTITATNLPNEKPLHIGWGGKEVTVGTCLLDCDWWDALVEYQSS